MTDHRVPASMGKATYHLHPDDADAYKAIVARMAAHGSRSPGCLFFNAAQDAGDPTVFYLFEGWDGDESLAAFHGTDDFQAALRDATALRITGRGGEVYAVTGVQDMPMPS